MKFALPLFLPLLLMGALCASGADLSRGKIIDPVECQTEAGQSYALYLPSGYNPSRRWSVIFIFDPGGRGRRGVERYQAAAEKYGYILAGSNNSRNGPWEVSLVAAKAMMQDVDHRFTIDPKRAYTAGMSGGARVALKIALDSGSMAGVFASSAGFPDEFHNSVPFPIFGTAGSDDFNHQEMWELDTHLTSAHRVEYFGGGHAWLPAEVAMDGVEWMELQAMKARITPLDPKWMDEFFARRVARADAAGKAESLRELRSIVADFQGLKDVTAIRARAAALDRRSDVKDAERAAHSEQEREARLTADVYQLRDHANNPSSFAKLQELLLHLNEQGQAAEDTAERRVARRVLGGFIVSSRGAGNSELRELLNRLRPPATEGPR